MAFILVLSLLIWKAYSFDECQIVLLQMHGKHAQSKAALQPVHDWCHNFFIFFSIFCGKPHGASLSWGNPSVSATAKCGRLQCQALETRWRMFPFRASPAPRREE
jgi:hypothetical protein